MSKKIQAPKSVIVRVDELKELLNEIARLARVYATLGYYEDKNALYALIARFEERVKGGSK